MSRAHLFGAPVSIMTRVLTALLLCSATALATDGWEEVRTDGSLRVERRRADNSYFEFRVTTHSRAAPTALAEAVWTWDARGVEARMVERREVLSEAPGDRLVYSLVRAPIVSSRETLVRFKRDDSEGAVQIAFASETGTPVASKVGAVRVNLRGLWRFEPDGAGATRIEYRIVSDPGGGIPAWMVKGTQEEMAIALVKEAVARAELHKM